jgi:hypothetical protein
MGILKLFRRRDGKRRKGSVFVAGASFGEIGQVTAGGGAQFSADYFGGEAGAQQAAIKRSKLALVERQAEMSDTAFQARAHEGGFVGFSEDGLQGGVDVTIRDAPPAKLTGDAEAALTAELRVLPGIFQGVARIVKISSFAQAGDDAADKFGNLRTTRQVVLHFVDGVCATHESAQGERVKVLLSGNLFRGGAHEQSIGRRRRGDKAASGSCGDGARGIE